MAMKIVTHTHACAQGNFRPPTYNSEHFERILFKYARFSTLPRFGTYRKVRNKLVHGRETSH